VPLGKRTFLRVCGSFQGGNGGKGAVNMFGSVPRKKQENWSIDVELVSPLVFMVAAHVFRKMDGHWAGDKTGSRFYGGSFRLTSLYW